MAKNGRKIGNGIIFSRFRDISSNWPFERRGCPDGIFKRLNVYRTANFFSEAKKIITAQGEKEVVDTGVIHGRFQVLHNDHLKYLMAGKARCRHLVVGITNPDPSLTREDPSDPERSRPGSNPLTYFERYVLIRSALRDEGLDNDELSIVPFPVNFPDLYRNYLPLDATFFLTIYDRWGERKLERFQSLGLRTEVLWRKPPAEKGLSATEIRERMIRREPWEDLVPPSAARLMKAWDIPGRLRAMRHD